MAVAPVQPKELYLNSSYAYSDTCMAEETAMYDIEELAIFVKGSSGIRTHDLLLTRQAL